jgi:RNA polymerase sigma-70 factor (ECF subfamily)
MDFTRRSSRCEWATTVWTDVFGGRDAGTAGRQARGDLLVRYHEVVYRYFLAATRDPHAADDLYSDFAERLLDSPRLVQNVDPTKGRFRPYLRTVLKHMVTDYYRGQHRRPLPLDPSRIIAPPKPDPFAGIWQQEMLNHAWEALEVLEKKTGRIYYTVLRLHSDTPGIKPSEIAERLRAERGRELSPRNVSQLLHRARRRFAGFLVKEVKRTLAAPTQEELEDELRKAQLFPYYKAYVKNHPIG